MAFHPFVAAAALMPMISAYPIAIAQQSAPEASNIEVVDTARDRNDRMTVPVRIGEKGPFHFLIDTGAERTVLARHVATGLGLVSSGQGMMVSVAGTQMVDLVDIDELSLGRRSFYSLSAPLLDAQNIGADGIVGLDSLQKQRVLLDFDNNRMAIGDARELGGNRGFEIVVTARRRSGQLIMADALVDGIPTDILIDTGADSSIGNRALQRALSRRHAQETTQLIAVTGQQITADVGMARTLKVGGLTMTNTTMVFADAPPFERLKLTRRPAMLMGMSQLRLFHRVAIDFSSRTILFDLPDNALLLM